MNVRCIPLTSFIHGRIDAHEGRPFECDESLAGDLERAGLIRISTRAQSTGVKRMEPDPRTEAGKALDDGRGQPSSSSPAALVLPTTTLHLPARGPGRPRKTDV